MDNKVYLWSVPYHEFLVRMPLFKAHKHQKTYQRISRVEFAFLNFVAEGARNLIFKTVKKQNYSQRLTLVEVLEHPWITADSSKSPTAHKNKEPTGKSF